MARKDAWKTDRAGLITGDTVMEDAHERRGRVVKRISEDTVLVKFEDSDQEEEVRLEHLRRLMR